MGTRGAYGFIFKGEEKITYNHFDSYPDGLGNDICDFVKENFNNLESIFNKLELIESEDDEPNEEQKKHCVNLGLYRNVSTGKDWYAYLRNAQGDLSAYTRGLKYMIDSHSFMKESLWCEWAYIINLDTYHLEVYEGFNKNSDADGRYAKYKSNNEYYGVKLIMEIPLVKCGGGNFEYDEEKERFFYKESK